MKINPITPQNKSTNFKGIITRSFIKSVNADVQDYMRKGLSSKAKKITTLYNEIQKNSKGINIIVAKPPVISVNPNKKIIPNKTKIYTDTIIPRLVFFANKKYEKIYHTEVQCNFNTFFDLPHKTTGKTADGRKIGVLKTTREFPDSEKVLKSILSVLDKTKRILQIKTP